MDYVGITGTEPIIAFGILFEIIGFVFLLPKIKEKIDFKYGLMQDPNTIKLRMANWFYKNRETFGIFLVMFGLVIQIIALVD